MSFSLNEKVKIAEKVLFAGVFDADPTTQWYESVNPSTVVVPSSKVWTQVPLLRQHPAGSLATARSNAAGPLSGVVQDLSQLASAVRLTAVPGVNNTYAALSVWGNFTSTRLEDWLQPQLVPQSSGVPSNGYAVRLYDGNPATTGVEVLTTTGTTGTGANKSVAWIWNYSGGILVLADDFDVVDPWVVGFRYVGQTASDISAAIKTPVFGASLSGAINGVNRTFVTPAKFVPPTASNQNIEVFHNGRRLTMSANGDARFGHYTVAESLGPGSGYDTVVFLLFSPKPGSDLRANFNPL